MRSSGLFLAATLALGGSAQAGNPLSYAVESFFGGYRAPRPPVSGDCAGATWFGSFSGNRRIYWDQDRAYGAQGCFHSEVECRLWQRQAMDYAYGVIVATSCRPFR